MNQEPNPLFTDPTSGRRMQWLKIAGYIVLLLLAAWLYSLPSGDGKPAGPNKTDESVATSQPDRSEETERTTRDDARRRDSTRPRPPRRDDDGEASSPVPASGAREDRDADVVVRDVRVTNEDGRVIYRGDIDLTRTLDRIERGQRLRFSHDGIVFENREKRLPIQASGYYREYVHPTTNQSGPGGQRVVIGRKGEAYYTPDHYHTFRRVR